MQDFVKRSRKRVLKHVTLDARHKRARPVAPLPSARYSDAGGSGEDDSQYGTWIRPAFEWMMLGLSAVATFIIIGWLPWIPRLPAQVIILVVLVYWIVRMILSDLSIFRINDLGR